MVKNEASVMCDTLKPFIDTCMTEPLAFFIFDTGSTDSTMAITQQYFEENNVHNTVIKQEPFIDFATSRNRALELAEQAFPAASFMLMLDAEWYLHNVAGLIDFCHVHKTDTNTSYLMRIMSTSLDFYTPRLIRCRSGVQFVGKVHEVLNQVSNIKAPQNCFFIWNPSAAGQEKSRKRWLRDLDNLLKVHKETPQDPRTTFYIAQTYQCLNDLENARIWYELRTKMPGWDEENFMAHYRLAQVNESLNCWDRALANYLEAFSLRHCRAEPLVRLAEHYYKTGELALCFLFSQRAAQIPYPAQDVLFIDKELYTYTRYDLLGISAWYMGEYELGKEAIIKALEAHPEATHLHTNFVFYNDRVKTEK